MLRQSTRACASAAAHASDRSDLSLADAPPCCSLEQCGFQYVPRGSFFVAWLYQQAATESVERFILFEAAFCACFMALCASWVMVLFIPQVHGENRDIRQQRSILLLVPAQLIRSSPCLKTLLTSIMQNADNAVGEPPALDSSSSLPSTVTSTTTALAI